MFKGIIPPIITPFHDDLAINEAGYAELIEFMIAGGVHGIVCGGTTGESYALTRDERVRQFRFAREVIGGRVPLICGVNDMTTTGVCAYAAAAREAGADGILIAAPPYSLPTERELAAHCLDVDRACGLPIMLYNYPGRTGVHCLDVDRACGLPIMLYNYPGRTGVQMGADFLEEVSRRDTFKAIKEASGDIDRLHLLARDFPHIDISCGAEDQALEFFVWGATSWVTPMGNFFVEEAVDFYNVCTRDKDFDTARAMMTALLPLMSAIEGGGNFAQSVKYAAAFQGLPAGPVRPPMREMKEDLKHELHQVLETVKATLDAIRSGASGNDRAKHVRLVGQG